MDMFSALKLMELVESGSMEKCASCVSVVSISSSPCKTQAKKWINNKFRKCVSEKSPGFLPWGNWAGSSPDFICQALNHIHLRVLEQTCTSSIIFCTKVVLTLWSGAEKVTNPAGREWWHVINIQIMNVIIKKKSLATETVTDNDKLYAFYGTET